ncbi:hypothetical protein ACNOYE_14875 [Nannocystaceae bacterium ST9]
MTRARTFADALARALAGSLHELPSTGELASVIVLPDGRVPVLVRDFGHSIGVCVAESNSWSFSPTRVGDEQVREIVASTNAWAAAHGPDAATLHAIVFALADTLARAFGERWTVGIPGTPDPREAWLHGSIFAAASVGVFVDRVCVQIGDATRQFKIGSRRELFVRLPQVVAAVREQHASHRRNLEISRRIRDLAGELATELNMRLGSTCTIRERGSASHSTAIVATIVAADVDLVELSAEGDAIRVHAGSVGRDGWAAIVDEVAPSSEAVDSIVAAVRAAQRVLTLDQLVPGRRYRVLESVQELREGMIVRFERFDDVDNHYGRYEFVDAEGRALAVCGDFSSPRSSPLAEVHRQLAPVRDTPA